ncbi:MAG TPA: hypothetical protein VFS08_19355, partial [Gemmatimonadaceae bacterium]|nr:hypothetical protein [Gemmatimonadaceae bacterium]
MSDDLERLDEHGLPAWVGRTLREPVAVDGAAKARLMGRVRAAAAARRRTRHRAPAAWRTRRGLTPVAGLAAAAAFAGLAVLGSARGATAPGAPGVLRDTAYDTLHDTLRATAVLAPLGGSFGSVLGDSLLRDTLRLVRFVLVAPNATRLALAGDFNGWSRTATPMTDTAGPRGTWTATLALAPGAHRYAFVVDDTRTVADPATPAA